MKPTKTINTHLLPSIHRGSTGRMDEETDDAPHELCGEIVEYDNGRGTVVTTNLQVHRAEEAAQLEDSSATPDRQRRWNILARRKHSAVEETQIVASRKS